MSIGAPLRPYGCLHAKEGRIYFEAFRSISDSYEL